MNKDGMKLNVEMRSGLVDKVKKEILNNIKGVRINVEKDIKEGLIMYLKYKM